MKAHLFSAIKMFAVLTLLTGVIYPLVMTGVSQLAFPSQANGSLVEAGGKTVGSSLIGQGFASDTYFWPRPSAIGYNPLPSSGSNMAATNLALDTAIRQRRDTFLVKNHLPAGTAVSSEMLTASASGLDPHISPEAAMLQVARVAAARHVDTAVVSQLVREQTEGRQWGILGDPRVNVLALNMALDRGAKPGR